MLDILLSTLAPHPCYSCGAISAILCESCKYDIENDLSLSCIECGQFSPGGICKSHDAPYEIAWCIGERRHALEALINQLKFHRVKDGGRVAATLLDDCVPFLPATTIVTTIPTSSSHVRGRGYDHAQLIAKRFARLRRLPYTNTLARTHDLSQKNANRNDRMMQAKTAFFATKQLDPTVPYLLIDDVVTTGATLRYAAEALAQAGAQIIWVAVIARQPLD